MPTQLNRAISRKLQAAQVAIFNTLADADLQAAVAANGYTPDKLRAGEQLYQRAVAAVDARALALAAQKTATAHVQAARATAQAAYQTLAQTARVVLTNAELAALGLDRKGGMPRRAAAFSEMARILFGNARQEAEISAQLAAVGYGPAWIDQAAAALEAWQSACVAQNRTTGESWRATTNQTDALRDLTVWVATYIKLARIVLREQPALLEKIGVKVRTVKSAAQLARPQKAAATRRANRLAREAASPPRSA
jgi:hypothetical protein